MREQSVTHNRPCQGFVADSSQLNRTMAYLPQEHDDHKYLEAVIPPFAGRLGGNQDFIVDRNDPKNVEVLKEVPDAAPCMTLAEIFDLRGFLSPDLWKFAMLECVGKPA